MTRLSKALRIILRLSVLIFFVTTAAATPQLYRFKSADGKTVLSRTIPPELVGNGYEVLNEKGRVISTVPPALTPEQIAARDAELARQKQLAEEQAIQAEKDAELKQLYSHPDDAVRILERKAKDILGVMQAKQSQIEFSRKNIIELEQKAAELQRKGVKVPERYDAQLSALRKDITNAEYDIVERASYFETLLQDFDQIVKRLEVITGKESALYESTLQNLQEIKQTVKIDN